MSVGCGTQIHVPHHASTGIEPLIDQPPQGHNFVLLSLKGKDGHATKSTLALVEVGTTFAVTGQQILGSKS